MKLKNLLKRFKRKPRTVTSCDRGHEFDAAMQSGLCPHAAIETNWRPRVYLMKPDGTLVRDEGGRPVEGKYVDASSMVFPPASDDWTTVEPVFLAHDGKIVRLLPGPVGLNGPATIIADSFDDGGDTQFNGHEGTGTWTKYRDILLKPEIKSDCVCLSCGADLRTRNLVGGSTEIYIGAEFYVTCFECGAEYRVVVKRNGDFEWFVDKQIGRDLIH